MIRCFFFLAAVSACQTSNTACANIEECPQLTIKPAMNMDQLFLNTQTCLVRHYIQYNVSEWYTLQAAAVAYHTTLTLYQNTIMKHSSKHEDLDSYLVKIQSMASIIALRTSYYSQRFAVPSDEEFTLQRTIDDSLQYIGNVNRSLAFLTNVPQTISELEQNMVEGMGQTQEELILLQEISNTKKLQHNHFKESLYTYREKLQERY